MPKLNTNGHEHAKYLRLLEHFKHLKQREIPKFAGGIF
jgi:hypothetical protein